MNNYSNAQLQKIVDDAPEGITHYDADYHEYLDVPADEEFMLDDRLTFKLSDIRAELLARQFKVGDLVVFTDISCFPSDLLSVNQMTEFEIYLSNGMSFRHDLEWLRHATAEEIAVGHRIDKAKNHFQSALSEAKAHIESLPEWQRQGLSDAMNASHRIDEPASSCGMTALEIDQFGEDLRNKPYVDLPEFEQPDSITAQLDPAKCRVVDPTVYDAPTDSPRDDFDAMSESHRSPACKCHEFPFDAELEVPVVASQQQIGGDHYTKLAIQPMHYSMANKLNPAQHTIIKYVTRYPDKGGIQDLLKARHTIDLLIERLEGEQGE